jgi:hypothetical protein
VFHFQGHWNIVKFGGSNCGMVKMLKMLYGRMTMRKTVLSGTESKPFLPSILEEFLEYLEAKF